MTARELGIRSAAMNGFGGAMAMGIFDLIKDSIRPVGTIIKHRLIGNVDMSDSFGLEIFKNDTPRLFDCVMTDLKEKSSATVDRLVENPNGLERVKFVGPGYHTITYRNKCVNFEVEEDKIVVWIYYKSLRAVTQQEVTLTLIEYLGSIYAPPARATKQSRIYHFIQKGSVWNFPEIRRGYTISQLTSDQVRFMEYIDRFLRSQRRTKAGCLIHGLPGTGKSAIIQHMATVLNRRIYHINLNDIDMTDVIFTSLMAAVEAESIIVIDEFEKQYANISANPRNMLSDGAILNALDGSIPISHKVIIIMISNNNIADPTVSTLPDRIREPLFRSGRIGKIFEFTQTIVVDDDSDDEADMDDISEVDDGYIHPFKAVAALSLVAAAAYCLK